MRLDFAPMEGITGNRHRLTHHQIFGGVDRYYMPFISPTIHRCFTHRELRDISPEHNAGIHAVPQVLCKVPEDFCWAAGELQAMGYQEVNLNLGCPSGTVVSKRKGSGMLLDLEGLEAFLSEVYNKATVPISIKTRLGLEHPEEFERILEIFNQFPICELTIHPRVRKEFYKGEVHMDAFRQAANTANMPLCYNGDVVTAEGASAIAEEFPQLRGIMVGRGLLRNPALARQYKGGAPATREEIRTYHYTLLEGYIQDFQSARNGLLRMKETWSHLIGLFADSDRWGKRLMKSQTPAEFSAVVEELLKNAPFEGEILEMKG